MTDSSNKPTSFKTLASGINGFFWYRRTVSEGTKGPIEYEFTKRRVILAHQGLPLKTIWLLVRRTLGKDPHYSYFISNVTTNACSQMLPERATIDSSSISLFSLAYAWMVIKKITIAYNQTRKREYTHFSHMKTNILISIHFKYTCSYV
jgi:hypothetical protein